MAHCYTILSEISTVIATVNVAIYTDLVGIVSSVIPKRDIAKEFPITSMESPNACKPQCFPSFKFKLRPC